MSASAGIHHVTAICHDSKTNVMFYTRSLGLRMVKKTVNFDDPTTWHLYYGDETGRPGTALTFFAWDGLPPGRNGNGMAVETAFIVPFGSLGYWRQRLTAQGIAHDAPQTRFGESVLAFHDPDGMRLALVAIEGADQIPGWSNADVAAEHALRGLRGVTLMLGAGAPTARVLTDTFGFKASGSEGGLERYRPAATWAQSWTCAPLPICRSAARALAPSTTSRSVRPTTRRRPKWSGHSRRKGCARPSRSTAAISVRFIFESRAACCSRSRPTIRASPSTSRKRRWATRSSCRPGMSPAVPRSWQRCRRFADHRRGKASLR